MSHSFRIKESTSGYLTNSKNSKFFPFYIYQNQPPKSVVFLKYLYFFYRAVVSLLQNVNKMSFPFNFKKISKGRHFMVTRSEILKLLPDTPFDTSFQNNVLVSLQLFSFVCYKVMSSKTK